MSLSTQELRTSKRREEIFKEIFLEIKPIGYCYARKPYSVYEICTKLKNKNDENYIR